MIFLSEGKLSDFSLGVNNTNTKSIKINIKWLKMTDGGYTSKRNTGRVAGMKLLIYQLKTPFQYHFTLKQCMYQDKLFNSNILTMKVISSQSHQYFESIILVSIFGEE